MQVFNQEEREAAGFRQLAAEGLKVANSYAIYQGLVEGAGRLAINVGTVALLSFGGKSHGRNSVLTCVGPGSLTGRHCFILLLLCSCFWLRTSWSARS